MQDNFYPMVPSIFLIQNVVTNQLSMLCIISKSIKTLSEIGTMHDIDNLWLASNLDFGGLFKPRDIIIRGVFSYVGEIKTRPCSNLSKFRHKDNNVVGNRIYCVMSILLQKFNMSKYGYDSVHGSLEKFSTRLMAPMYIGGDINYQLYNKSHTQETGSQRWYVPGAVDDSEGLEYMIMLTRSKYFNFEALIQPLTFVSWLLAVISSGVIIMILKIQNTSGAGLWIFAQILGQDSHLGRGSRKGVTISMVILFWLAFTFLLRNEYTSNLTSYLMTGPNVSIPRNLEDVYEHNIPVLNVFRKELVSEYFMNSLLIPNPSGKAIFSSYPDFIETLTGAKFELSLNDVEIRQFGKQIFRTSINSVDIEYILRLFEKRELFNLGNVLKQKAQWPLWDPSYPRLAGFVSTRDNLEITAMSLKYLTQGNRNFYKGFGRVVNKTLGTQNIWYFSRKFYAPYMARYIMLLFESGIYEWWAKHDKLLRKSIRYKMFTKSLELFKARFGIGQKGSDEIGGGKEKDSNLLRRFLTLSKPRTVYLNFDFFTQISEYVCTSHINSYPLSINVSISKNTRRFVRVGGGYDILLTWSRNTKLVELVNNLNFKYVIIFTTQKFRTRDDIYLTAPSIFLIQNIVKGKLEMLCIISQSTKSLPEFGTLQDIEKLWHTTNLDFKGDSKRADIMARGIFMHEIPIQYKPCSNPTKIGHKYISTPGNRIYCVMSIFCHKFNMSCYGYGSRSGSQQRFMTYLIPPMRIEGTINYQLYNKSQSQQKTQKLFWLYVPGAVDDSEGLEYMIMMTRTKYFNFEALIQPLNFVSWILAIISGGIVIIILKIQKTSGVGLWTYAQIVGQDSGMRKPSKRNPVTIGLVIIFWLTFTFLLQNEYTSNLTSYIMAGRNLSIPQSLYEVYEKNVPMLNIFRKEGVPEYFKNNLLFPYPSGEKQFPSYHDFVEMISGAEYELTLSDYELLLPRNRVFRTYIIKLDIDVILRLFEKQKLYNLESILARRPKWPFQDPPFPQMVGFVNTKDNLEIIATVIKHLTKSNRNFYRGVGRVVKRTLATQNIWYFSRKFYVPYMARYIMLLYESGIYEWWAKDDKFLRTSNRYTVFTDSLQAIRSEVSTRRVDGRKNVVDSLVEKMAKSSTFYNQYMFGNSEASFSHPNGEVSDNTWEPISSQAFVIVGSISFGILILALVVLMIEIVVFKKQ
ncbi:unnamed protein product [Orchesella dallaii]|uniref:Uncharacterized protein n=1 Tax=Orchesella dallaii TaxID=48710 RepID=A0ABP1R3B7_9HEXA